MPFRLKTGLHWAGSAIAAAGVTFIAVRLYDYSSKVDFDAFSDRIWWVTVACTLIYSASSVMLALAWYSLLKQFGYPVSRRWAVRTYGISQIAKYVPGNIFQFAGRQAMGMASGLPAWPLAKSSIWELGLLALSGLLFGLLTLPLLPLSLSVQTGLILFLLATVSVSLGVRGFLGRPAMYAFGWYIGFLAISGGLFISLVEATASPESPIRASWIVLCGAYVTAWLLGLVTPGAPAGVGIREIVLIFLLKGLVGESELLLAILLGRFMTVIGDVLFLMASLVQSPEDEVEGS